MATIIDKLNKSIDIAESNLIGVLYKSPDLFSEITINKDELSDSGLFYYGLGEKLYENKYDTFDEVSIYSILDNNQGLKTTWDGYGGWNTIKEIMAGVSVKNYEGYMDTLSKYYLLRNLHNKGFDISVDFNKFNLMTTNQVYDFWEYQLNSITIDSVGDVEFESLCFTDDEIRKLEAGEELGLNYGKYCPILNNLTMGIPQSEMTLIAGYVNSGKSSWSFANIVMPIVEGGHKCLIISNEQKVKVFKMLLMIHILTNDLKYYGLTRKKLKSGKYTAEDKEMMEKAREVAVEKYDQKITFVKLFEYNSSMVKKIVKKMAKRGVELVLYDTFKASDSSDKDGKAHEKLVSDSRDLFQIASKENLAFVATAQLALNQMGKRFLDLNTLAGARAISEVCSEVIQFRDIFTDEFKGEKYDIKPYRNMKDKQTGKYTGVKEEVILDTNKKYKLFFLSKTRNDEAGKVVIYEVEGAWNKWREVGFGTVSQTGF